MTEPWASYAPIALGTAGGTVAGAAIAEMTHRWPKSLGFVAHRHDDVHDQRLAATPPGAGRRRLVIILVAAAIGAVSLAARPLPGGIGGAIFGWMLLALLVLDVEYFWLPDRLTVPLAAMGLAAGIWLPPSVPDRLIGAAAGFASLAGIAYAYRVMTGRVGLGGGDPRLFAAIGAWLGWVALPFVLLLAASFGLALVAYDRLRGRAITRHSRIPLGALLAAAAWLLWVPGPFSVWER